MKKTGLFFFLVFAMAFNSHAGKKFHVDSSLAEEPVVRVFVSGRRGGIKEIKMETYLTGVIGNEMGKNWPVEALKAQAVAARSYAMYRIKEAKKDGRNFDVLATQGDQVFKVRDTKNDYLMGIVKSTEGEVLWKNGVVEAFYSSTCGGKTRPAREAELSESSPLKKSFNDSYCNLSPFKHWIVTTSYKDLTERFKKYGIHVFNLYSMRVWKRSPSGYVKAMEFKDDSGRWLFPAREFRKVMGVMRVKSLFFDLTANADKTILIRGSGFGHGVGLCQYGAKTMAVNGNSYKQILAKYYPRIKVVKVY